MKLALTFDDVLLVPQKSFHSPSMVSTKTKFSRRIFLDIPIISAPMDTVTESKMAIAIAQAGGIGVLHKNMTLANQAAEVKKVKAKKLLCGGSVSVGDEATQRAKQMAKAGVDVIVVDVAHGHFHLVAKTIKRLKKDRALKKIDIIGGNIATAVAARELVKVGADAIKVGVGPGSICTTRVIAGIGVPQLTAVMDVAKVVKGRVPVIADGGIRYSGDMVKALAAGANTVMLGSLLAATAESPGKVITIKGKKYKAYRGMGSIAAMKKGSKDRYQQTKNKALIAEGVEGIVEYKGKISDVIDQLVGGLKQGLGYCGARDIKLLQKKAKFVKITQKGLSESHPHSLVMFDKNPNYSAPKKDSFL